MRLSNIVGVRGDGGALDARGDWERLVFEFEAWLAVAGPDVVSLDAADCVRDLRLFATALRQQNVDPLETARFPTRWETSLVEYVNSDSCSAETGRDRHLVETSLRVFAGFLTLTDSLAQSATPGNIR